MPNRRRVDYVHFNPVKHGHAKRVIDWPYSGRERWGSYPHPTLRKRRLRRAELDRPCTTRRHGGIASDPFCADNLSQGNGPRGGQRVIRGGSWNNKPRNVRSANRNRNNPDNRNNNVGFRLAQSARAAEWP
jgi:hypothetical protein